MPHKHSPSTILPGDPIDAPEVADVLTAFGELLVAQRRLRGRDARDPGGLSFAQLRLLAALEDTDGCRAGVLAEQAGVSPATVTGMLDGLEAMGMVVRSRSTEDRRAVLAHLTDEGRRVRDDKRREVRRAFGEALAELSPQELELAPRVLRVMARAMEEM